ncbi:hypothetical protein [Georgenia sp. SUBG003]|uniref:hypothetical protein n=1 Tax=Georgenia sp. SUBG003 TaxID=1497974 RepID=UPI003AB79EDB
MTTSFAWWTKAGAPRGPPLRDADGHVTDNDRAGFVEAFRKFTDVEGPEGVHQLGEGVLSGQLLGVDELAVVLDVDAHADTSARQGRPEVLLDACPEVAHERGREVLVRREPGLRVVGVVEADLLTDLAVQNEAALHMRAASSPCLTSLARVGPDSDDPDLVALLSETATP